MEQLQLLHGNVFGNLSSAVVSANQSARTGWIYSRQLYQHDISHWLQHILHFQTVSHSQFAPAAWNSARQTVPYRFMYLWYFMQSVRSKQRTKT